MLRLRLLGSVVCERDGEPVRGFTARQYGTAILALLARAPSRTLARGKLVGCLWPEVRERTARSRLSTHVHAIRDELGETVLLSEGDALRLNLDVLSCDVCRFEEAVQAGTWGRAVELYRGPFLEGFRLAGSSTFEKWLDRERAELRRQYLGALEELADRAEEREDLAAAARWWQRFVEEDPYDSRATVRLIDSLTAAGNPAEALRAARVHEQLLAEELGAEPSAEVRARIAQLETGGEAEADASATRPAGQERAVADVPTVSRAPGDASGEAAGGKGSGEREAPPSTGRGEPKQKGKASTDGRERSVKALAGAIVLLAVALGTSFLVESDGAAPSRTDAQSVAVLPFEAVGSEDPGPVAQGLHTDLLSRLAHVSRLDVISATSVGQFRRAQLPLPVIADSLGVDWVVEGNVQRADGAVQVQAQLVDPSTDTHVWAETYRRELTAGDLFEVQADISRRVAGVLTAKIDSAEKGRLTSRPTGDLEAYRFYLRGRGLLEQRTPSDIRRSLDYFDQAIAEDSAFALAWAGRADALAILARFPEGALDTLLPRARTAAERALALDPDLAEARVASGRLHMYRRDAPAALRAFEQAVALRPSYAAAHAWLAKLELSIGRPGKALEDAQRSVELNPLSPENLGTLTIACHANGQVRRVLEISRRIRRLTGKPVGHERVALAHLSRLEELRRQWRERGMRISEHPLLALYVTEAGGSAPVEEALRTAEAQGSPRNVALLRAVLGDEEQALEILDGLYPRDEIPWDLDFTVFLRYDSYWPDTLGQLRESPQYHALMREINVRWGLEPDGSLPGEAS